MHFPIVVKIPEWLWCSDGWNQIEIERKKGSKKIQWLASCLFKMELLPDSGSNRRIVTLLFYAGRWGSCCVCV